ncbi:MAG: STAS domain-containing protein [Candidatus Muirbacterium halophilum]|nr:STAS domain-containing protein [Candidatus Muirbacterium halophilum]
MNIEISKYSNICVVKVIGNIKYDDIDDFDSSINQEIKKGTRDFIFDMKELPYINSAVIGEFVRLIREIHDLHGKVFFCGVRPYLQNILEITGLVNLFQIFPDLPRALEYIQLNK